MWSPPTFQSKGGPVVGSTTEVVEKQETTADSACLPDTDVLAGIEKIAFGETDTEQQAAVDLLRDNAKRSPTCRMQVITAMINAMERKGVDLRAGGSSFFLWHYGTRLLTDLKAVEALDLFISRIDLDDGTPFPLNHHPAINGVCDFGELAIPKLGDVLMHNPDSKKRTYAVFCIGEIGGHAAKRVLEQALLSETDPCVMTSVKALLKAFNNQTKPNHMTTKGRSEWYPTFLCAID